MSEVSSFPRHCRSQGVILEPRLDLVPMLEELSAHIETAKRSLIWAANRIYELESAMVGYKDLIDYYITKELANETIPNRNNGRPDAA